MLASGGRTWWAHFEFTRINIEPTIIREKIERVREARDIAKRCGVTRYRTQTSENRPLGRESARFTPTSTAVRLCRDSPREG